VNTMNKQDTSRMCREQNGFTLIELLIGITIAVIIAAAAFTALTSSSKATRANDQIAQTQQSARIAMELLSHDIKMAGYGMTGPVGNCATAIVSSDNTAAGPDTGPDSISLMIPTTVAALLSPLTAPFGMGTNPVKLTSASGFAANSFISIGGVASATVASVSVNDLTLSSIVGAPAAFPTNTPVYLLQCVTYQVIRPIDANAAICGGNAPCLARGVTVPLIGTRIDCNAPGAVCSAIAEGIEDLQLAYACDGCNIGINGGIPDRVIDDQGAVNNIFDTGDFVSNSNWGVAPMTPDSIRLVLVNIVAREARNEQGFGEGNASMVNTTSPIVVQDHNPSIPGDADYVAATYQQFRRRLVTRTVEVRNIGL
jgi:type IV pilus assembly protein PilW